MRTIDNVTGESPGSVIKTFLCSSFNSQFSHDNKSNRVSAQLFLSSFYSASDARLFVTVSFTIKTNCWGRHLYQNKLLLLLRQLQNGQH